ncbi:MAG: GNAT family N-acetyltransferase, partial [Brevundimonas sp.]
MTVMDGASRATDLPRRSCSAIDTASAPLEYDTLPWAALTDEDRAAWKRIRSARPQLASPFFSLGWHDAVDETRADVEFLRISRNGEPAGFLPFSRSPFGMLHPVGAPMADWHGLVGPVDLQPGVSDLLRAARGRAFRFSGAPADDPLLQSARSDTTTSFAMDLSDGYDAYEAEAKKIRPKAFRNLRARARKLHERHVEIHLDDRDPENLARVLAMKRAQYRRTRQIDIFSFGWTRELIDTLLAKGDANEPESIRGLLSTLWIDGSLAAGHLGLKDDTTLHYWFPVYDARFA